jgi:hypothetical protein
MIVYIASASSCWLSSAHPPIDCSKYCGLYRPCSGLEAVMGFKVERPTQMGDLIRILMQVRRK